MAIETERKFLVKGDFKPFAVGMENIIQAYLSVDIERTIRVRLTSKKAFLTIKGSQPAGSISRKEWEMEIPLDDAREIIKICLPGIIEKTRYFVPAGKHTFEVDEFHGRHEGLLVAEIELDFEDEDFTKPEWLGEEVTGNPKYFNSYLIRF